MWLVITAVSQLSIRWGCTYVRLCDKTKNNICESTRAPVIYHTLHFLTNLWDPSTWALDIHEEWVWALNKSFLFILQSLLKRRMQKVFCKLRQNTHHKAANKALNVHVLSTPQHDFHNHIQLIYGFVLRKYITSNAYFIWNFIQAANTRDIQIYNWAGNIMRRPIACKNVASAWTLNRSCINNFYLKQKQHPGWWSNIECVHITHI